MITKEVKPVDKITSKLITADTQWQSLIKNAPDFILIIDLESKITFINRTLEGFTMADVIGKPVLEFIPPSQHHLLEKAIHTVIATAETVTVEHIGYGPDGTEGWYCSRIGTVVSNNKILGVMIISSDITAHKLTEQALEKSKQDLARMSRSLTIGALTSGLAHELNQPLSAIVNYSQGSLRRLTSSNCNLEEIKVALNLITEHARYASEVITSLKSYLKDGSTAKEIVNINEIIAEVYRIMPFENKINVSISYLKDSEQGDLLGNKILLQQVFINILTNAVEALQKAEQSQPRIDITISNEDKTKIIIKISDSGPGVIKADIDYLFLPFFTRKNDGIGLGLSICKQIIDAHSGKIFYESNNLNNSGYFKIVLMSYLPKE